MTLEVPSSKVTVTYNSTESQTVELQCEASGYIRPDSDIRWFREEEEIGEGVKYNVSFRDGHPHAAQTGHLNETTSSRISVLTIYEVNETDVGTYSCQSLETGEMASLHLNVEVDPGKSSLVYIYTSYITCTAPYFMCCYFTHMIDVAVCNGNYILLTAP